MFLLIKAVKTVSCLILSFAVSFAGQPAWEKYSWIFSKPEKNIAAAKSVFIRAGLPDCFWDWPCIGWQWGSLEQRQIQADRDLVLYERAQRIELLNRDVERLNHDLRELKAEKEALGLTQSFGDSKLTRLIKGQIAEAQQLSKSTSVCDAGRTDKLPKY